MEILAITPGDCVAVVGAGGKTTLCWHLVQQITGQGGRVVFTTTTHIRQPAPGAFDLLEVSGTSEVPLTWLTPTWRTACIASGVIGEIDDTPLAESTMPVVHTKLKGFSAQQICEIRTTINHPQSIIGNRQSAIPNLQSPISFVVEADGARGLWLKAPAEHEPVIPPCATVVCVVANAQALGRPLDERVAHRPEHIAKLAGIAIGEPITPQVMIDTLAHSEGGLKGIPAGAHKIAVLSRRAGDPPHPQAAAMTRELTARGFDQAVAF